MYMRRAEAQGITEDYSMNTSTNDRLDKLESMMKSLMNEIQEFRSSAKGNVSNKLDDRLTDDCDAKIKSILNNFDFHRVKKVMEVLNWEWASSKHGVPDMDEIRKLATRLLIDACIEEQNISTGGFKAVYEDIGDGDPYVGLEFIVEECEGFAEE